MKMIKITTSIIILTFLFAGCNNSDKPADNPTEINQDSLELTNLFRQFYKWHETADQKQDFATMTNNVSDTAYSGIDWTIHNDRMKELKESNFFAGDFLDEYQKIASQMDEELKTGKTIWLVDDVSPYGNDVNPWCNCQDYPDNYWDRIMLTNLVIEADHADFNWTWGDNFNYKAKAKKEKDVWKISYLEGFDSNTFTK